MTLVVEDGSVVSGANSYASLETIKAYAAARGVTLGADAVIEQQAIIAVDYIESFRLQFQGIKVSASQPMQFPRIGVEIDGFLIDNNVIPNEVVKAQCQLVCEQANDVELMPTKSEPAVKKEVVGPIETEYAVSNGSIVTPVFTYVDNLLRVLFKNASFAIKTVRV